MKKWLILGSILLSTQAFSSDYDVSNKMEAKNPRKPYPIRL
ncbi:hypothetical protein [Neisseria sp.]